LPTKIEDGVQYEAGDYCYVPDADSPSTWKLRITDSPGGKPDPGIVGAAAAALGPGFRGQRVELPDSDRPGVIACVRRAWKAANPDKDAADMPDVLQARSADEGIPLTIHFDTEVEVRDAVKREIDVRLVPWDFPIDTLQGREQFVRGAFDEVEPTSVLLMGLEHEAHIGVGQNGQPVLTRRPVGRSIALDNKPDGQHATFRVAKTNAGDELLELAAEKIVRGVSVEFIELPGGTTTEKVGTRRTRFHRRAGLPGASLTYRPAYGELASVLAVRSEKEKEPVTEPISESTPVHIDVTPLTAAIAQLGETLSARSEADTAALKDELKTEIDGIKEQMRTQIAVPPQSPEPKKIAPHIWLQREAFRLTRDRPPAELVEQFRALDDVTVANNEGLFPPALVDELIGDLPVLRPFLSSTRQVDAPATGTSIQVPKISQHTEMGVQATEKTAVASRDLRTVPVTYDMVTVAGAVDVSLQFIKRGSATANQLIWDDMKNQYAQVSEDEALDALLAEADVVEGGTLDPEDLEVGASFTNAWAAMNQGPDTLWLGTSALAAFIDAKASTTNAPLYGSIQADINAAGGIVGTVSGLRVVHVPQLTDVDAIIGPRRGFAWAEDGTFRLETDNPELAGRDLGLVGFLFFMPRYPAAFTSYTIAS
jgi:phage head maturation protease